MNNCLFLGEQDFYVGQGKRGPVVCSTQNGVLFVMFHADPNVCPNCDVAKPEFMQLSQVINGAKFGLCNLNRAKNLVDSSFNTITPLNVVPLFILFVNGRPFMNYNGQRQLKHFAEFMQVAMKRLSEQQTFGANGQPQGTVNAVTQDAEVTPHGIAYDYDYVTVTNPTTIGNVTCEEGVCYLTAGESYSGGDSAKPSNGLSQSRGPPSAIPQQPQYMQQRQAQYQQGMQNPAMPQYGYAQPSPQQAYYPPQQMQQMQRYAQPQAAQQAYYPPPQAYYPPQQQMAQQAYYPPQQPQMYR
jgi:hypothetical protein